MVEHSPKVAGLARRLTAFMDEHVYPNEDRHVREVAEGDRWQPGALLDELKAKARDQGLWNLFLPDGEGGPGLSNLEYAPLCEIMGRVLWAPEVFNCSAPDTGNMEVLLRYGTPEQRREWLEPLLEGRIRSCFAMTEPAVASSDATNIESSIRRDGDSYVLNGRKWFASGGNDRRCKLIIFMGKTDPHNQDRHRQQSMILVPMNAPRTVTLERIAESRILIDQARLLVLQAAHAMDTVGNKLAAKHIAMIKVAVPNAAQRVIDYAIQAHGAAGLTDDFGLAAAFVMARMVRIADGPDEVHRNQIGKMELSRWAAATPQRGATAGVLAVAS